MKIAEDTQPRETDTVAKKLRKQRKKLSARRVQASRDVGGGYRKDRRAPGSMNPKKQA